MKSYHFAKNMRIVAVALCVAYLVFGAGAVFTGYQPTPFLWISGFIITVCLVAFITNRPTPPQTQNDLQKSRENSETK